MRRLNVDRMRKVNLIALYENFPRRWVLGLPVDETQVWDSSSLGAIWALPDDAVLGRRPKSTSRWTMRRAEDA